MVKNKLKLNIIASILSIVLILTGLIFTASVFGWFSNNKVVSANGMTVTVDVPKNIYVSSNDLSEIEGSHIPVDQINNTDYSFDTTIGFAFDQKLYPSSYSGDDFYFARKVMPNGTAKSETNLNKFVLIDSSVSEYYYIEKTFYILTTYRKTTDIDLINVYLSNVTISQGSNENSNLYKAVRIAISAIDKNGAISEKIYRYDETDGACLPASGVNATVETDPALDSGDLSNTGSNAFLMDLGCVEDEEAYFYPITVKIWIEGQNSNAITSYAGTGFYISFKFKINE